MALTGKLTAQPATSNELTVNINAVPGMQFDVPRFAVEPGQRVKLVFTNMDDMSHNLLITVPGARVDVVNEALKLEEKGPAMNYIPESDKVLWSIPVISVNQSASISFTAPGKPGAYPYVCTYPGHGFIMYGVMHVSAGRTMPALKDDDQIPPSRRTEPATAAASPGKDHHSDHPYTPVPPYLYRIFMEDSGPASIAVSLPGNISYCWDAGSCRLRYAWSGGFVDNAAIWKGHIDANAKIVGAVFYREYEDFPIRIGSGKGVPVVAFKGYALINKYPEFHYTLDGVDVYELISSKQGGDGLVRTFRIPEAGGDVQFHAGGRSDATTFSSDAGKWENGVLKLTAEEARKFEVSMTNYTLFYNTRRKK